MLKRIFAALGAMMLVFGLIGGASATSFNIVTQSTTNLTQGDDYTAIDGQINVGSTSLASIGPGGGPFGFVYEFVVAANSTFNLLQTVSNQNEGGTASWGIQNLTYTWTGDTGLGLSGLLTAVITDGDSNNVTGSDLPFIYVTTLTNATAIALSGFITVTGFTEAIGGQFSLNVTTVPLPATALLFGSALLGGGLMRRRKMIKKFGLPA